jgi:ferritin-like metal-binding protein YciE
MNAAQQKVVQYLDEARATEQALARVLQSQIVMTPRGSYRSALESHLEETRDHAARVDARLDTLGRSANPLMAIVGLAETVLGQALALGKAPFDLLRGSGGEEKVLKNAKDVCASESLEIATYTAIERLARSVGDEETAKLAASIRADEEKMLERVLREIPELTEAVTRADVKDEPAYDVGADDSVRAAGKAIRDYDDSLRRNQPPTADVAADANGASAAPDEHDDLRAAATSGDVRAALKLGMLLWERRDVDAAEGMLRRAAVDPQGAHALGQLLWRERDDPDGAVHWLDRAAQADDPAAERDLGIVLRERGDLHGARHWLSRAADRDGEAREALASLGEDG